MRLPFNSDSCCPSGDPIKYQDYGNGLSADLRSSNLLQFESVFCVVAECFSLNTTSIISLLYFKKIYSGCSLGQVQNYLLDSWATCNRDSLYLSNLILTSLSKNFSSWSPYFLYHQANFCLSTLLYLLRVTSAPSISCYSHLNRLSRPTQFKHHPFPDVSSPVETFHTGLSCLGSAVQTLSWSLESPGGGRGFQNSDWIAFHTKEGRPPRGGVSCQCVLDPSWLQPVAKFAAMGFSCTMTSFHLAIFGLILASIFLLLLI